MVNLYNKLEIDFEIPNMLQDEINGLIDDLNNNDGKLADCFEAEIRSTLNSCDTTLTESQIELLRDYYQRGGIFELPLPTKSVGGSSR